MAKILIVDDDDLTRQLFKEYLVRDGYTVITAATGDIGIELFEQEQPDLVLLDIAMPAMSGIELAAALRRIQEDQRRPHVPLVAITAYARSFIQPLGSDARFDSLLNKPLRADTLRQHVNRFLGGASDPGPTSDMGALH